MALLLVIAGVVIILLTGRHHLRAQQARESYVAAKANLPELRKAATAATFRAVCWIVGVTVGFCLIAYAYIAAHG
jgi:hypothetical protein